MLGCMSKNNDFPSRKSSLRDFDAVVIGSGIGGLTAAALLARLQGWRVLVLERHWKSGGFTHTFSRPGGYHWDVGLHYVGREIVTPGLPRDAFQVATAGRLNWQSMPDPFERLCFPGFQFNVRAGRRQFADDLKSAFPHDAQGLGRWFRDVDRASSLVRTLLFRALVPEAASRAYEAALHFRFKTAATRTADYLARRFSDPRLIAILGARWGDYGLPPAESAFFAHAMITRHYLDGALYPVGSASRIAEAMGRVIREAGGEVRVRSEVSRIIVQHGRARGVRLANGEEVLSPVVISDAGARNTYLSLLPEEMHVPGRDFLRQTPPGAAHVTLYLGLSRSPTSIGVRGENLWLYDGFDHDALWASRRSIVEGQASHAYLSFPSVKDPEAKAHTAEIIAMIDTEPFESWQNRGWKRRGADYEQVKERISDALLDLVERHLPGFRELVAYRELSTPLSTIQFTAHPGGAIYGLPWNPTRLRQRWLSARTPVSGLYLTGADAVFLGIVGATMGGVAAAGAIAGPSLLSRIGSVASQLHLPPSEKIPLEVAG